MDELVRFRVSPALKERLDRIVDRERPNGKDLSEIVRAWVVEMCAADEEEQRRLKRRAR